MSSIDIRTHTAIHVVKGALQKILGVKWTASVYTAGTHGGIAVQCNKKPTDEEMYNVEILSNEIIKQDLNTIVHEIQKIDAEKKWGDAIYDLFPIPQDITVLKIFELPGWNINTCNKQHTKKTGEIGKIKIQKTRFRAQKQLLEISFDLID
ncbi:alanyl-tRNA editing protein [Candidatus Bathyarchaeota archaeon]|nr:alanyl-tRNA editing protein [Candidatus Bathyarchaeota archaeon]